MVKMDIIAMGRDFVIMMLDNFRNDQDKMKLENQSLKNKKKKFLNEYLYYL